VSSTRMRRVRSIVHVECVGDYDEISALYGHNEGLISARFVEVVCEAQVLEDVQSVDTIAHPVSAPTFGSLPCRLLNACYAVFNEPAPFLRAEIVARCPCPAMRRRLMTPANNSIPDEEWVDSLNINFLSAVRATNAFPPALREAGSGAIINIASGTYAVCGGSIAALLRGEDGARSVFAWSRSGVRTKQHPRERSYAWCRCDSWR
jgi:NAD(P)-dependent dehydrogenase (short-subunit alcohol dehydrogenase family)